MEIHAHIHSLDGEMQPVTILEHKDCNNIIVKTQQGVVCHAVYNIFVGAYYADDKYGIIENGGNNK